VKILLADDNVERANGLAQILQADPAVNVIRLRPGELLPDGVAAHAPDIVIVDMSRPDRDALEAVRHVSTVDPRPIVMFVDQDDPAFMEEAIAAGVLSYNVAGIRLPDVKPILRAAAALFRQQQTMQLALQRSEARLRERTAIDRAKGWLIRERRMTEPEAHRWLQRRAMTRGCRLADIAEDVLRVQENDAP
jgi:two-component system, response regulator / RNA-binding antiterminator